MSNSQESPAVQALHAKYRASLPDKAQALRAELSESADSNGLEALAGLLHRLAGSAGMYGFNDVAAQARVALQLVETGSDEASNSAEMYAAVQELCVKLEDQTN